MEQQTNPSPGPWHVGGKNNCIVYDVNGMPVASATAYIPRGGSETATRNAQLIAEVPTLLKSLEWAVGMAEEAILTREDGDDPQDTRDIIEMHRAELKVALDAIKRAKGATT